MDRVCKMVMTMSDKTKRIKTALYTTNVKILLGKKKKKNWGVARVNIQC